MPTAGPNSQVLALINPGALSQNKLGWSAGQAKHSLANSTAVSLGLAQELVRPALPGSLRRKRRRRRVEMQSLEEEPKVLGRAGLSRPREEEMGWRNRVQFCDIEGWASERGWGCLLRSEMGRKLSLAVPPL